MLLWNAVNKESKKSKRQRERERERERKKQKMKRKEEDQNTPETINRFLAVQHIFGKLQANH